MSTGKSYPIRWSEVLGLAVPPEESSPVQWLERELCLATGEGITRRQAQRYYDIARLQNRLPKERAGSIRDILLAALAFAEDRIAHARQFIETLEAEEAAEENSDVRRTPLDEFVANDRGDSAVVPEPAVLRGKR